MSDALVRVEVKATGAPASGKTHVLRQVVLLLQNVGFLVEYTGEHAFAAVREWPVVKDG